MSDQVPSQPQFGTSSFAPGQGGFAGQFTTLNVSGASTLNTLIVTGAALVGSLTSAGPVTSANGIIGTGDNGGQVGTATFRYSAGFFVSMQIQALTLTTAASLLATNVSLTDNSGAAAGTLLNAPTAGNPTKWIAFTDNGVTRKIPTWT